MIPAENPYEPRSTGDGWWTVYSARYQQCFHSTSGALEEARERYVVPCRVVETARRTGRVRILDVGFGLGYNLACALAEVAARAPDAVVEADSLEQDRSLLALVAAGGVPRLDHFPGAAWTVELARSALATEGDGRVTRGHRTLRLLVGDARERFDEVEGPYDAVFLDPFSPGRNPELWEASFLTRIARRMTDQAILSTYSAAARVRVALLQAGLKVGQGGRVGKKAEGTLASRSTPLPPLPAGKLTRLRWRAGGFAEERGGR